MEARTKQAAVKLEKLDTDLKNYRSNGIKESIRRGHDDLGDHFLDCGDLTNALKCYSRYGYHQRIFFFQKSIELLSK